MWKTCLILTLWFCSFPSFAKTLSELLAEAGKPKSFPAPSIHLPPTSEQEGEIRETVSKLESFANELKEFLFLPKSLDFEILRGEHYLYSAGVTPQSNKIELDESVWARPRVVAQGLIGHEFGHLLFRENTLRLLRDHFPSFNISSFQALADRLRSDASYVREFKGQLERAFPVLLNKEESQGDLPIMTIATYSAVEGIHAILTDGRHDFLKGLTGETLAESFLIIALGGVQEVYADFVGALFSKDPACMGSILEEPVAQVVRNFTPPPEHEMDPDVAAYLVKSAEDNAPHLLLFEAHKTIHRYYYAKRNRKIGADSRYDAAVAQQLIDILFAGFLKVFSFLDDEMTWNEFDQKVSEFLIAEVALFSDYELTARGFPKIPADKDSCDERITRAVEEALTTKSEERKAQKYGQQSY